MKAKNKGETEKFAQNKRLIYATIAIITIIILASIFFYIHPNQPSQPKAAIIDQLSSSQLSAGSQHKNETFVKEVKELLYKRFSEIDYYSDNATVDQYSRLSSLGYKLIVWRVHSALDPENYVAICSSERYDPRKYEQYSVDQLKLCNITGDPYLYFAITPYFIKECMSGRFEDTVIIFMSCNGLKEGYYKTAETFIEKGVKVFISWDGWILPIDSDNAITLLLQYLINENNTISNAVNKIPKYSSPFGPPSQLEYHPISNDVSNYRIPNYKQSNTARMGFAIMSIFLKKFELELD
jgi:hypothetical protein